MFNLKRIFCYWKTFTDPTDVRMFFIALFQFGAIYIAHDWILTKEKFNRKTKKIESTLVCQRCGLSETDWRQL